MTKVRSFLIGMLGMLVSTTSIVNAEELSSNLDAHVHGLSELTIAMDDKELEIQFVSPAMNIVGFEYQATTQKDIATVQQAAKALNDHQRHFAFPDNECRHIETDVNVSALLAGNDHNDQHHKSHSDHSDHHGHAKKAHHDDHKKTGHHAKKEHHKKPHHEDAHHKKHGRHKDHHDSHVRHEKDHSEHKHTEHDEKNIHSEIFANHEYRCNMRSPLDAMTVTLFDAFPGIQKINVVWVNQTNQGAVTLTPDNKTINF